MSGLRVDGVLVGVAVALTTIVAVTAADDVKVAFAVLVMVGDGVTVVVTVRVNV